MFPSLVTPAKVRCTLMLIAFVGIAYLFQSNVQLIISKLDSFGMFAPVLFLILYCLGSIFCVPVILFVLAGGAIFGPVAGTLLNVLGATTGAACGFCISRYFKKSSQSVIDNVRLQKLMMQVERQGWKSVALLRLAPGIPFNLVNYGLGLTRIKFSHYLLATMIFLIPNKIIITCCGYYGVTIFDQIRATTS